MNSHNSTMRTTVRMVLSSFATRLRRRAVRPSAWFEEETKQHASADNLGKRAEGKERNQDQQQDDRRRNRLMQRAAANFGQGIGKCAMVQVADDQLLQHGQGDQQRRPAKEAVALQWPRRRDYALLIDPLGRLAGNILSGGLSKRGEEKFPVRELRNFVELLPPRWIGGQ